MKTNEPWSDIPECELYDNEGYFLTESEDDELIFF